jgi:predicted RNA-binding protein with PUA-like domain
MPNYWLCKTEPDDYSYADLERDASTIWDGVNNPSANINIRNMKPGDFAFIYHTGNEKRIAGLAKVISKPYEDPKHPGLNAKGDIARPVVDLQAHKPAKNNLTLADVKADERFNIEGFELVRLARLSVMPVPPEARQLIKSIAGI